eukprot:CAMPEP_0206454448 /NCGR_PEP_ID=MMETSP0324_2-20121206/21142_1 /ASSEMBLY_ACC=CAM_ASM_000836 /TAXON_ID=2866 /ORGANISM="Crypthecodinium cohnii, Strain Seligo" /LENGTH=325 /DNA_ID=CAMNT_0053924921 /DNA_START=27 /DNA_END=1004 /DNA_ORIENTATION=-
MMMPSTFSKGTLNDNWFEDRLHPHADMTVTTMFQQRAPRERESDLAFIGKHYDVLSTIARIPPRPSFAMPDDGFNELATTHQVDFGDPKKHPTVASKRVVAPPMINTANAPVLPPEKRELEGPSSGFGAEIPRHSTTNNARSWSTSTGDFYAGIQPQTARGSSKIAARKLLLATAAAAAAPPPPPASARGPQGAAAASVARAAGRARAAGTLPAGLNTEDMEKQRSGRLCGSLCGEELHETSNPALDTRTQRAWLPGGDPSLVHLGSPKLPHAAEDNELSLNFNGSAMSKIRNDLKDRKGLLYRTATNITKAPHQQSGYRVFIDD